MNFVILAGGGGTRLWPLSRKSKPKQFIKLFGNKTLIELTYNRLRKLAAPEKIFVVLNKNLLNLAKKTLPNILTGNFIIEPARRDTTAAFGLACAKLFNIAPDESVAFIPSDHFINDTKLFCKTLRAAEKLIDETKKLVDIAVFPTFPSTALGYTKIGKQISNKGGIEIFSFLGHKEKPNFDKAKKYIQSNKYLWHASYYMWTPRKFLEAFEKYSPTDYKFIQKMIHTTRADIVEKAFNKITKKSLDYVITEKIKPSEVLIIKGAFGWSDVGAFDVLYDAQQATADTNGNVCRANFVALDSSHCLVYGNKKKTIAAIGVNNLAIIDTPDALLVCPLNRGQDVKKVVKQIKENKK
ncbi:mannose-1-phosphate guanylyltransferase [Candidatus Falkowbacteria bacterium]|nr:mannose-1-phosphate guanylyltransferase [Candidatus Falkowbacteria bacterium]